MSKKLKWVRIQIHILKSKWQPFIDAGREHAKEQSCTQTTYITLNFSKKFPSFPMYWAYWRQTNPSPIRVGLSFQIWLVRYMNPTLYIEVEREKYMTCTPFCLLLWIKRNFLCTLVVKSWTTDDTIKRPLSKLGSFKNWALSVLTTFTSTWTTLRTLSKEKVIPFEPVFAVLLRWLLTRIRAAKDQTEVLKLQSKLRRGDRQKPNHPPTRATGN